MSRNGASGGWSALPGRAALEKSILRAMGALNDSELQHGARWLAYLVLVGVVAGVAALVFDFATTFTSHLFLEQWARWTPMPAGGERTLFHGATGPPRLWLIALLPAVGGLLSGVLVQRFAPEASGHGTDAAIRAYHRREGFIRPIVPPIKMLASAITIGTAGSGGREGPIAQVGAGFGSLLATHLRLSHEDRRVLLAAGMGAGVGSIFRAPLAGALFASEIFYRSPEFESSVMLPACVASIVAYCTFTLVHGTGTLFSAPTVAFGGPMELLAYSGLAVVLAAYGFVYVRTFYGVHARFERWGVPRWTKPMIGGLLTGLIGVGLFLLTRSPSALSVLGIGYGVVQHALDAPPIALTGVALLAMIALGKILTTSLTIGSGGSAGVFGPSMVIGGCVGGAVGSLFHHWWPHVVPQAAAFVIVGMAGFFSGIAKTPISTLVMVSEMTGSYALLLPSLWVCVLTFALSRGWGLYSEQVMGRIDSPAHQGRFAIDVLRGVGVGEVLDSSRPITTFALADKLDTILSAAAHSEQATFPVLDERGSLAGVISLDELRHVMNEDFPPDLLVAQDLMVTDFPRIDTSTELSGVARMLAAIRLEELPISDAETGRVVGLLSRRQLTRVYVEKLQWSGRARC